MSRKFNQKNRLIIVIVTVLLVLNIISMFTIYNKTKIVKDLFSANINLQNKITDESERNKYVINDLMKAIETSGMKLNNISIVNHLGDKNKLFNLITDTTIVYFYANNGCKTCLVEELTRIKKLSEQTKHRILCISDFEQHREFMAFIYTYNLKEVLCYNTRDVLISENKDVAHIILQTDASYLVKKCFYPDKMHPELNVHFSNLITHVNQNGCVLNCASHIIIAPE